jgi:hypothetical protein
MTPITSDTLSQTTATAIDSKGISFELPVEYVDGVPETNDFTALIVRLPAELAVGDIRISITFRGAHSNEILVSIRAP